MTPHPSMRGYFAYYLYQAMLKDPKIVVVTMDLGYGLFDKIRDDFPERFYNVGASEQAGLGICVGLALEGMKVFAYSITTFLLYRAFETIKLYINGEKIPVRLIGGGRDKDYAHDGPSHDASDAHKLFYAEYEPLFGNIESYWPETKEEIPNLVDIMVKEDKPTFISLRR